MAQPPSRLTVRAMARLTRSAPSLAPVTLTHPSGGPDRVAVGFATRSAAHLVDLVLVGGVQAVLVLLAVFPSVRTAVADLAARPESTPLDALRVLLEALSGSWVAVVVSLLVAVVLGGTYEVLMTYRWGATVGKLVCSLRVLDADTLTPPTLRQCLLRWAGPSVFTGASSLVPGAGLLPVLGYLWCLVDARNQAAHDHLARTVVVEHPPRARSASAPDKAGTVHQKPQ